MNGLARVAAVVLLMAAGAVVGAGPAEDAAAVLKNPTASADAKGKACESLMKMGSKAAPAVPALIQQLKSDNELLRDYAVTTLGKIGGPAAAPALPALRRVAKSDASESIRELAEETADTIEEAADDAADSADEKPATMVKFESDVESKTSDESQDAKPTAKTKLSDAEKSSEAGVRTDSKQVFGSRGGGKLPDGYTQKRLAGGCTIITAELTFASAQKALRQALRDVGETFTSRPVVTGGFADKADKQAQVVFETKRGGEAQLGLAMAGIQGDGATVGVLVGPMDAVRENIAALQKQVAAAVPSPEIAAEKGGSEESDAPARPATFSTAQIPDGSGTLRLAEGWSISGATKSMVTVAGPGGREIDLGVWFPFITPAAEMAWKQQQANIGMIPTDSGTIVANISTPGKTLLEVLPQIARKTQQLSGGSSAASMKNVKIVKEVPTDSAQGTAAFVLWEADRVEAGKSVRWRSLAWITVGSTGGGQGVFYYSQACAPAATFNRDLPTMMETWTSWKVNDRVFRERLTAAAKSMAESSEIVLSGQTGMNRARDRAMADWSESMRGYRTVERTDTGERGEVDLGWSQQIVDKLNERAGGEYYQAIPLRDQY